MSERVIPIIDQRPAALIAHVPAQPIYANDLLSDTLGRPIRDLRISVTDRCNFRCGYCMPKSVFDKDYAYLPHNALLSFEEITRTARLFAGLGVQKLRITGGEPLLRKNIDVLIAQLAQLLTAQGQPLDITLTTNGSLLRRKAQALKNAGLQRVTVSLDSLDDATFRTMNDVDFAVADVLDGIAVRRMPNCTISKSIWWSNAALTCKKYCRWRVIFRAPASRCGLLSTWMWARPTAGV